MERKAEKRSLYCDMRDEDKAGDTMDNWDENKLKEVVEKKHGAASNRPTTDIVRQFLSATFLQRQFFFSFITYYTNGCIYRFANTSLKLWRSQNTVGSGNVQLVKSASTGTRCRLDLN